MSGASELRTLLRSRRLDNVLACSGLRTNRWAMRYSVALVAVPVIELSEGLARPFLTIDASGNRDSR